jgi:antirestriction protein ArdC
MTAKKNTRTLEERRAQAEQLHSQLADQVASLADSGQWQRFLDFTASFHSYSLNNTLLIWAQMPDATRVAGFRQWEKLGRHVRKGEKSIKIFGYSTRKVAEQDEKTGEDKTTSRPYFPVLSIFDIGQTELEEGRVDDGAIAHKLTGADEGDIYGRVSAYLRSIGWDVSRGDAGRASGYTTIDGTRRIVVADHLEPAQAAKTVLHEAAHAILHSEESAAEYVEHRGTKETESESTAYVMAAMLGLDTSAYSVGYVAGWAKADAEVIRSTAANVLRAVATLSAALLEEEVAA